MGKPAKIFILVACWVTMFTPICFAEKGHTVSDRVGGEIPLLAADVEGHEIVQMAYFERARTDVSPAGYASDLQVSQAKDAQKEPDASLAWEDEPEELDSVPDPLEPMNRAFFVFNDRLYFWFFKPVATGYNMVVPEVARVSIRNFFTNLVMPIRAISCLLQGKFEGFGIELTRFVVNTTAGFLGFQDVARQGLNLQIQDEDLGQVFAFYGIGPGFYLNLPILGAYTLRDSVGWVGGLFLNPLDFIVEDFWPNVGIRGYDILNKTSLRIGEYEAMKEAALDPYVAMRDAYYQYRLNQIEK